MGLFDWLFKKNEGASRTTSQTKINSESIPNVTFTVRMERVEPSPVVFESFTSEIAGVQVKAEVPIEAKAECERLLKKESRTDDENEYLYYNYWVNVYYKNERHAYNGVNDVWTHSVRDLPEYPLLYEWIYKILDKKKLKIDGSIVATSSCEESGNVYVSGEFASMRVELSFKPRGYVLNFLLNDGLRWEDKATFNTKTGQNHFPFYYSEAQEKIIEWGKQVYEEKRVQPKGGGE